MGTISVKNLGKAYKQYPSRWSRLAEWLVPFSQKRHKLHWVLQDINFDVAPGEAIGIIGINGAGKSTLLKLITGTTQPTTGSVTMNGRVAALLELGMGFHPDFTGRQNAFMAGQLLGLTSDDISKLMPEIEAFADIGDYLDQPVRVYSSGMQVRLAFSVATAVRPDILIIDEALSVGDSFFQHKCIQRIRNFQEKGTTLLFVSHSPEAIRMLCQRSIMLANGAIAKIGDVASVMDFYQATKVLKMGTQPHSLSNLTETESLLNNRDNKIILSSKTTGNVSVDLFSDNNFIGHGDLLSIRVSVLFNKHYRDPHIGFGIRTKMGINIYEANTYTLNQKTRPVSAGEQLSVTFSFPCFFAAGTYELLIGIADGGINNDAFENTLFFDQSFMLFEVSEGKSKGWCGLYDLQPTITIN